MGRRAACYLVTRNHRHSLRTRVPLDLVPRLGRVEVVRAIGTPDFRVARAIALQIGLRLDRLWLTMRDRPTLTPEALRQLADEWLRREIEREWALLATGEFASKLLSPEADPAEAAQSNARLFAQDAQLTEWTLLETPAELRSGAMDHVAGTLLAEAGHGDRRNSRERASLSVMLLERLIELQQAKLEWASGNPGHTPPSLREGSTALPLNATADAPNSPGASRTLGEAIDLFIADMRQRRATEKQINDAMVDFRVLLEVFGRDRQVGTIGAVDAGKLWEALRALPAGFRKAPELKGLGTLEQAAKAREFGLEPMHFRTANSYVARWRKLFDQEIAGGQVPVNPFDGKRALPDRRVAKQDRTFTPDELEKLFGNPLFQGARSDGRRYDPGDHVVSDWMFWSPLIALLSGARIGEIAQLRPQDIRKVGDYTVFDINDEDGKTLKNQGTARQIPVHPVLAALGLVSLAEARQASGRALLLPGLPAPILGDAGAAPSKWMSERFLTRIYLKRKGLGFHSFRHTLKTLLANAEVPDRTSNNICGHDERTKGVAKGYGSSAQELEAMAKALERVSLPSAVLRIPPRAAPSTC